MRVLVTGGAGYIGSHTLVELLAAGHEAFVIDNLCNGHEGALARVKQLANKDFGFVKGDIRDSEALDKAFLGFKPEAVIHFAGLKAVGESVEQPLAYYENNVAGSVELLKAMDVHDCKKIVFSSSATVYGTPQYLPLDEDHPVAPVNPYGQTKLMVENILKDWAHDGRSATALRYFNPVGAHVSGRIGEDPHGIPNNLMPYIAQVAIGKREALQIFGDDYETRDGTGERDYIHVTDLAKAHLAALDAMLGQSGFEVYNIGTGSGASVKELLAAYETACGHKLAFEVTGRRSGDVASSVASPKKANERLHWVANLSIDEATSSSWQWQSQNPDGYAI
ncbi:UDP-glucose 4-epimerase GalE [Alphaproteobacteria bacterium]|nr:UDP-glucose 4-epimerase GalE [Alphaproteobacteria bacterium]